MNNKIYRIILIIFLLLIAPMIVNAEDVFEHDKINGNVFLKGKYLQLGINASTGVFGTIPIEYDSLSPENLANLKKYATTELKSGESLGMRYNEYGWDSGIAPKTGDFTVNANKMNDTNSSKDTLAFIYCYGDVCKTNSVYSLRGDGYQDYDENTGAGIKITGVSDASDPTNKILKAVVDGQIQILKDNKLINVMLFKITYSFKNDSKYIHTSVEVTNWGTVALNNLRVMRLMNPDQDKLINRTSLTYNKVITKAKSGLKDPGYSMIVSRGETTLDGMFYLSFAGNSYPAINEKYYTVNNTTEAPKDVLIPSLFSSNCGSKGTDSEKDPILNKICNFMPSYPKLPNTASSDSLSIFYQGNEENGHTLSDTSISMLTVAGNVAANEKKTVEYYTSLDNNVITGLAEVLAEHNADIISRTDTTIKIKTIESRHYAIVECPIVDGETDFENCNLPDNPETFDGDKNNELTFEHLKPSTFYKIYYKIGNGKFEDNALITKTKASPKKAVEIHPVVVTEDSITIKGEHGYEYSKDNGEHWQKGETFDGLDPDTEYTFVGRSEETFYDMPGEKSEAIKVKTLPKVSDAFDGVDARIDVKIVDAVPTIKFSKALLYDAIKDDDDLKAAILDGHKKVQIVFDVIKLHPNDEELQDLKPYMKRKKLAYGFDVEIKLYVNGEHIKDISELSKKIDLELTIPKEYKEKDKKFFVIRKHIISMSKPALYEILDDLDSSDDTISIKNDLFSEFYVAYESDEEDVVNPKTGEKNYLILLFISLLGIVYVYKESKNKSLFKLS